MSMLAFASAFGRPSQPARSNKAEADYYAVHAPRRRTHLVPILSVALGAAGFLALGLNVLPL